MAYMRNNPIVLGEDERYLDVELEQSLRSEHMHVVGATGSGKSRFLLSLIMQDIEAGRGLCLIDPHGELVDHVIDWLGKRERLASRRTVRYLNLNRPEYCFGFNPLSCKRESQREATVRYAVEALAAGLGDQNIEQMPLLSNALMAACLALSYADLTLAEAEYLLSPSYHTERELILSKLDNKPYEAHWNTLSQIAKKHERIYREQFEAAARRFLPFLGNKQIRRIIGQHTNTLDLETCLENREIILVDLSVAGRTITTTETNIIGRLLVNCLVTTAMSRGARKPAPFQLYIDEVQNYLSGDIPRILEECRKFGLHLTCAHQHLGQLRAAGDPVYDGMMGTARNKIVFGLDYPEDAQIMARRIFAGQFNPELPKRSMYRPVVTGHDIITLEGGGESSGQSDGHGFSNSESRGHGSSYGTATGTMAGFSIGSGQNTGLVYADEDLSGEALRASQALSAFQSSSNSSSRSSTEGGSFSAASGSSDMQSSSTSWTETSSWSQSLRPIIEERPGELLSLSDQMHLFTDAVLTLPKRHALGIIPDVGQIRLTTLDVDDVRIRPERRQAFVSHLISDSPIHRSQEAAEDEITTRRNSFFNRLPDHGDEPISPNLIEGDEDPFN